MDTLTAIREILKYWCAQDVANTVALMDENIVYQLNLSDPDLPYGGETRGRDALEETMFAMLADWDYLETDVTHLTADGDHGKANVRFKYHHRKSGGFLEGTLRFVFAVSEGLVTRIDEYHDRAKFETFLRLAAQSVATLDGSPSVK